MSQSTADLLVRPHVFVLNQDKEVLATVLANLYEVNFDQLRLDAFYFRYFASSPLYRGNVFVAKTSAIVLEWLKKNSSERAIFYAYLEKKNFHSSRLVASLGFEPVRNASTYGFSRFFPKKDKKAFRVTDPDEKKKVIRLLADFYRHHSMVNFSSVHNHDQYYVLREGDEIIAGVQAVKSKWIIQKMEGWSGKMIMKTAPFIPLINGLFNPANFSFVGLEGIYFKKGREKDLIRLFEHVLCESRVKSALFWQDTHCPYNLSHQSLGLINHFVSGTGSSLMVSFNGISGHEKDQIRSMPVYISCFDFV